MRHNNSCKRCAPRRRAFTLAELLIVIVIISMMAALALSALSGATEIAREQRTRAIISKLDNLIMEQYESYRTRPVPLRSQPSWSPAFAARMRLYALRDLMRMEMPDRVTDVISGVASLNASPAVSLGAAPSAWQAYRRRALRACGTNWATAWTTQNQGSECLYLIVSRMSDGDKSALDFFLPGEIGDTDEDGMKEILDGWGNPIEFMRWPAGFTTANGAMTLQDTTTPDPFDPVRVDPQWSNASVTQKPFLLHPLLVSAGRDKKLDIASRMVDASNNEFRYTTTSPPNNPYYVPASPQNQVGTPCDADQDGYLAYGDNITNHYQETP